MAPSWIRYGRLCVQEKSRGLCQESQVSPMVDDYGMEAFIPLMRDEFFRTP